MPSEAQPTAVERDKLEIDPNFDFRELAKKDYDDIPANVKAMFKWCGVYTQLQKEFFMIRLVTPGGLMTTPQLARALDLAEHYAQGELCITTRQTLQFHWVRLPDIHKVIEGMEDVGMTTKNGCGDVTRNTVTCSMQGVCPHEVGPHVRSLIEEVATDPEIRDQQRNLPRKHKISIAGCDRACAQTLVNCQGWVPVTRETASGSTEHGWRFHAGGGLGSLPYTGKVIFDWVPEDLALYVARATVEAFRRRGDRRKRALARLKIVVDRMGPHAFGLLLLDIMRERGVEGLDQMELAHDFTPRIQSAFLDGQSVISQRQDGLSAVRVMIPRSEIKLDTGRALCRLADTYGRGEVMLTNRQNVEISHVPNDSVSALRKELADVGLRTEGFERLPDVVCCVGTTQCKMAVSDTPGTYFRVEEELGSDTDFWQAVGPLRIQMTGCPNNCAHAWIGDIGLRGRRRRADAGGNVEGYSMYVGGGLADEGQIGRHLVDVDGEAVVLTVRRLLDIYLDERDSESNTFHNWIGETDLDSLRERLRQPAETLK